MVKEKVACLEYRNWHNRRNGDITTVGQQTMVAEQVFSVTDIFGDEETRCQSSNG